jgi:hypothetical protein
MNNAASITKAALTPLAWLRTYRRALRHAPTGKPRAEVRLSGSGFIDSITRFVALWRAGGAYF